MKLQVRQFGKSTVVEMLLPVTCFYVLRDHDLIGESSDQLAHVGGLEALLGQDKIFVVEKPQVH